MFGSLFRQAQATVDNAIGQALNRIVVAVPFIVALGFATAALSGWLSRTYGSETSNLILAAAYTGLGLFAALVVSASGNGGVTAAGEAAAEASGAAEGSTATDAPSPGFAEADRDLLITALSTAAPVALPLAIRSILRNLPLVLVVAIVAFILSRMADGETAARQDAVAEPAE